jgi:hypothetical protein
MKQFRPIELNRTQAQRELAEYRNLLESPQLSERRDLLPFFRERLQLAALMGFYNTRLTEHDRIAVELDLFGDFNADFAVGSSRTHQYCFIEFEDATSRSIFRPSTNRSLPVWSNRFERGYSQLIDWMFWLESQKNTPGYYQRFGVGEIHYIGLLVIGRDRDLADPLLRRRLTWRSDHVVVCSRRIVCLTFDELFRDFASRLNLWDRT